MAKDPEKIGASREVGPRYSDPFGMFRAEMDRLFDTFLGSGLPTFPSLFSSGIGAQLLGIEWASAVAPAPTV
jgi:hypothetical protein